MFFFDIKELIFVQVNFKNNQQIAPIFMENFKFFD